VRGKIFATLGYPDVTRAMVKLTPVIGACLLAPIAYVQNLALGPVRLHKRANRETLTLWFADSEYARLFEAQNAVSHDSSPWSRVL